MQNDVIESNLISILEEVFPTFDIAEIVKDERFIDQVPFDSIGQMMLLIKIKKKLGVVINQNDLPQVETYDGLLKFVLSRSN